MHIAIINSFPAVVYTAEMEYIHRFLEAAKRTGHKAYEVVTSDDINDCQPDFVLATHEFSPKLTEYFTLGAMWGPYSYILDDARKLRSVLSYDGYLVGSPKVGNFLDGLEFATGIKKPRSDFIFLPSALKSKLEQRSLSQPLSLAYVGVHWDGLRHNGLLKELSDLHQINIYGPENSWSSYPESYRGPLPFNGTAVTDMLRAHGIALCIHKEQHRHADTPSMRLFEAAAAGCIIIVDEIPFAKRVLSDCVFHINLGDSAEVNAKRIASIIQWINANRELANVMAVESHKILNESFSIESLLTKCIDFVTDTKISIERKQEAAVDYFLACSSGDSASVTTTNSKKAIVDIIVRSGGRDVSKLKRALRSISKQPFGHFRVLLVDYKDREDIKRCAVEEVAQNLDIKYINCSDTGLRSTSLWAGLREVEAPFFAILDDDDTVMPDHFANLLATAGDFPENILYYTGSILLEEEKGHYMHPVNFTGSLNVELPERRELKFMDVFSLAKICEFDNYILTNSWIARSSGLDERALIDPQLEVVEDMYLYIMLARHGSFKLFPSPTAVWHFRTTSRDNSMLDVSSHTWEYDAKKLCLRLSQEVLYNGISFGDMRHQLGFPAPQVTEPTIPLRSVPIEADSMVYFCPETMSGAQRLNVHSAESHGIWSSALDSNIHLRLANPAHQFRVKILFMTAKSDDPEHQFVNISVNGFALFSGVVEPWKLTVAEGDVHSVKLTDKFVIRSRCTQVSSPAAGHSSSDTRLLGVYLSSIAYVVQDQIAVKPLLEYGL